MMMTQNVVAQTIIFELSVYLDKGQMLFFQIQIHYFMLRFPIQTFLLLHKTREMRNRFSYQNKAKEYT